MASFGFRSAPAPANSIRPIQRASGKCERKGGDALGPLAVANMGEPISATDFRVARCVRMTEMDAAKIRMETGFALQSHVIRSTCAAFENLHNAIAALETLPVPAIEALRDYVADHYSKREGALGEFARAYLRYLETPLAAAQILERRARYGIEALGKTMQDYELKPRKEE